MTTKEQNYSLVPYQVDEKNILEVRQAGDDVWLTQKQMAQLFNCGYKNISAHLLNIFQCGELDKNKVVQKIWKNDNHASFRPLKDTLGTNYYNLDAIISVGYRVNSKRGVQFRQWATQVIKDRIKQQYAKTKQPQPKITEKNMERIEYIKNECLKKGITFKDVANELGLTATTISLALNGRHYCKPFENWLQINIFTEKEEPELVKKAKSLFDTALNGDYEAFKNLITMFKTVYNFEA